MPPDIVPVRDAATLEQLLSRSHAAPLLLFNHDPDCALSWLASHALGQLSGEVAIVDVRHAHDVTAAIETWLAVRHESPQAIVVRNGQAVWSASHGAIQAVAIERALREAAGER